MACGWSFLLCWGTVCTLFAVLFAQDSSWDCNDKDDVLRPIPANVDPPSACVLHCTVLAYRAVLQRQERLTVRFTNAHGGEPDEYCWSPRLKCSPGQRLQNAFVLLPVDLRTVTSENLGLHISSSINAPTLHQHTDSSLLSHECGLRFDVMQQIVAQKRETSFCIRIVAQEPSAIARALKCPPFLVTTWKQWNQG